MAGKGRWFDSADEAQAFVFKNYKNGVRNFDVGCFQINFKWHGESFGSIADMFDPIQNAQYAAEFLKSLHRELGDWDTAVGAFHSRTQKFADRYKARFRSHLESIETMALAASPVNASAPSIESSNSRKNRFPLLQGRNWRGHPWVTGTHGSEE